jgi:acetyltransferase-like isoleucine patch superfamily enzyme
VDSLILKIRRADTPVFKSLKHGLQACLTANLPMPRTAAPLFGALYSTHQLVMAGLRWAATYFYREPLFRGRCAALGKRFTLSKLPYIVGHTRIHIGDDVNFFGKVDIFSGRVFDEPKLVIHNRVDIGHNVLFVVNKEIILEDDVNVASGVRFMDTDAHPKDTEERIQDLPPHAEDIKPVRICRNAWIGHNSFIMKGVTIGEGAIIGVNSVVVTDIPAYSVAMGNPARVVIKAGPSVAAVR